MVRMTNMTKKNARGKDGALLYYETYQAENKKDVPPIFFLHGAGGDVDAWAPVRDALLEKGFSSMAMDLRGHGYSDHPRSFSSHKRHHLVNDVLTVMEQEGIEKIILIGHCYGAVIATSFALTHGEKVASLAIISGTYRPPNYLRGKSLRTLASWAINVISLISPKPFRPGHSYYPPGKFHKDYELFGLFKTIARNSLRSYLLTTKEIALLDLEEELSRLKMPTLLLVGEKDSIFPPEISEAMHKKIPRSEMEIVPGANHVVILNNIDEVVGSLHRFLAKYGLRT